MDADLMADQQKSVRERRKMGVTLVIYLIVLFVDLLVGSTIIVWKCVLTDDEEQCTLATGGTIGSVVVWLVLMLACPFCAIQCNVQERWHNSREVIKRVLEKLRPRKPRNIYIQSEIYLPTTLSLMDKGSRVEYIKGNERRKKKHQQVDPVAERLVPREATISDAIDVSPRQDVVYTFNERAGAPTNLLKHLDGDET